jgi:hypothetical protein
MSATEGEYIQFGKCGRDVEFFRKMFLQFLCVHCPEILFDDGPSEVGEDNKGTIDVVEGGTNSKKLRHLDHNMHYGRDLEEQKVVKAKKIHTDNNTADLMTKPAKSRQALLRLFSGKGFNLKIQ